MTTYLRTGQPREFRRAACACLLAVIALPAMAASPAEQRLFADTNEARAKYSLSPLKWDEALAEAAQAHAELVVQNKQLSHQYPGEAELTARAAHAGAHFQSIAENIAIGQSPDTIQGQWMNSSGHRANILDPNLTAVGFAAIERGGYLYAVADFDRAVPTLTYEQVEESVEGLLSAQGIAISSSRLDARQTCEMSHGSAGGSSPRFVMRWQSPDLTQLPAALQDRLRSGQYRSAAVGSCASANAENGFTAYRVAVLLY